MFVGTDQTARDSDTGLKEAVKRLRERLVAAEEAELRAHERAEALRVALHEVEMLIAPGSATVAQSSQEVRNVASAPSPEGGVLPPTPRRTRRQTTADTILDLLTTDARPWNATEIIGAVGRSEETVDLRDPAMAVRAALRRMAERGEIERVGRGTYQAVLSLANPKEDAP